MEDMNKQEIHPDDVVVYTDTNSCSLYIGRVAKITKARVRVVGPWGVISKRPQNVLVIPLSLVEENIRIR